MPSVSECLDAYNRKERFFLVGSALGNPRFTLGDHFRSELGRAMGVDVPEHAFVAMDYHLDWINAALEQAGGVNVFVPRPQDGGDRVITGSQEDIDLVVSFFGADGTSHVVLVEAKGDFSFGNSQMDSKACRLRAIFGEEGRRFEAVLPHFVLMSPRRPTSRLRTQDWPNWMKRPDGAVAWLELPFPARRNKVVRCDIDGRPAAAGSYWRVTGGPAASEPVE